VDTFGTKIEGRLLGQSVPKCKREVARWWLAAGASEEGGKKKNSHGDFLSRPMAVTVKQASLLITAAAL
jgi:hypothetical protein